ncbi:MAG: Heparinase II/III-like, partial [Hyphomicrobiales bacterium]|nr:Heparinase II/III-like [Hyphomicrobiales bacterium]
NYGLLLEGANPDQATTINRCLNSQIQSLRLRSALSTEPLDALLAAIAMVGVALCDENRLPELPERVMRLQQLLDLQIDEDGLHRTRSAKVQLQILTELVTIRMGLKRYNEELAGVLADAVESMHMALDAISLGTGEAAYFNGTGHLPHDLLISVQAQSTARHRESGVCGGYARLASGPSIVVADGGLVPPREYAGDAHASALAFEFSYRTELIVGSCGPAPAELSQSALLFRQGVAHSGPTINAMSAAVIPFKGPMAGRLLARGSAVPDLKVQLSDQSLMMETDGYEKQFGVMLERRMTLMAEGKTLVGQDRMVAVGGSPLSGMCTVRFHLASGTKLYGAEGENLLRLQLASGSMWTFIWEGAEMRVEDSVRQSAYFGFHRTRQIVLEADVENGREIAWIFTLVEQ